MTAVQTELDRRAALTVGQLVHYDTINSGRVPCKIVAADDRVLTLKVTGARYAYPRGHVFTARRGPFVVAR